MTLLVCRLCLRPLQTFAIPGLKAPVDVKQADGAITPCVMAPCYTLVPCTKATSPEQGGLNAVHRFIDIDVGYF
jgi:hypothetical protein